MRKKYLYPTVAVKIGQDISLTHKKVYPNGIDSGYYWQKLPKSKWKRMQVVNTKLGIVYMPFKDKKKR